MLTLDVLHSQSPRRVNVLFTTVEEDGERVPMHGTPLALIQEQAHALDISLRLMRVPPDASNATYEECFQQAIEPLLSEGCQTVAAGDIFLDDVKAYREKLLRDVGARPLFPLWKRDTTWLANRFLDRGYQAVITSVDTTMLDSSFVGRQYDERFLKDLPSGVDPCGEKGAFHTFVTDGPSFHRSVSVQVGAAYGDGRMRYVDLDLIGESETTE